MKNTFVYHVVYNLNYWEKLDKSVDVIASSKEEARYLATYEVIYNKENQLPYEVQVLSVTYKNGNYKTF